jgi:predicted ATPase
LLTLFCRVVTKTLLTHYTAVELIRQRALAAQPNFAVTTTNATAVAEICIGLDGQRQPIQTDARLKLFSPPALLARLQQRLTLLNGGAHDLPARQRTLTNRKPAPDLAGAGAQKAGCGGLCGLRLAPGFE